jgi:ribonuclease G
MRREILIDSAPGEIRVALLEDDHLTEVFIERSDALGFAGHVFKGRVCNVLPGMQSAFVDIGLERNAFLYVEDVGPGIHHVEGLLDEPGEEPARDPAAAALPRAVIEDLVREGQEIVVQVTKDPVARKGARVTAHVALPGRYLVYLTGVPHVGVSRRIEDPVERERLKSRVREMAQSLGAPGGFIVRTAGESATAEDFARDARSLVNLWGDIQRRAESHGVPAQLHREAGAVGKVLRDLFHADVSEVRIETEALYREAVEFMSREDPALVARIRWHEGPKALFEARGIPQQLERALRPKVWLKSGGYIVINPTEALVAIDVNTGKYVGTRRLEDTIVKTNLEAAREIVRQVRLRDLGGIIVVDFIDMDEAASREEVIRVLEAELRKDRSKSRMLQISEFGLVEITRQRTRPSLERALCSPCPACEGSGRIKSFPTVYFEILREARKLFPGSETGPFVVRVHPALVGPLAQKRETLAAALGREASEGIIVEADGDLRLDQWRVVPG